MIENVNGESVPGSADDATLLRLLAEADTRSVTIEELQQLTWPLFRGLRGIGVSVQSGTILYRARAAPDCPFDNVKELSYPPIQPRLQRASRPGRSMFYACSEFFAPIFELDFGLGERFIQSSWRVKTTLSLATAGYQQSVVAGRNSFRSYPELSVAPVPYHLDFGGAPIDFVQHCFSQWFTERVPRAEEHRYKRTVAIAELLLLGRRQEVGETADIAPPCSAWDGLMYPSVQARASAHNVALLPQVVDEKVVFESAEHFEVVARIVGQSGPTYDAVRLGRAVADDRGRLEWVKPDTDS